MISHRDSHDLPNPRPHRDWLAQPALIPLALAVCAILVALPTHANDWAEWRGKDRVGVWSEAGIVEQLPESLKVKWRVPINSGFSGPAVADGRVFITDWAEDPESRTVDGTERAIALDEETGEILWITEWPTSYRMLMFSYAVGPRATPTVDDDRVYLVGAAGDLFCLSVETGEILWEKHYIADYGSYVPTFGVATSPIVDGDRLITAVGAEGGLVMAFDKRTGAPLQRGSALAARGESQCSTTDRHNRSVVLH